MVIVTNILLSALSAYLYRVGGRGGFKNNKLVRRIGIPLLCYLPYLLITLGWQSWFLILLSTSLLYFSLTTYHDYLAPNGTSENWLCWLMTGLCYGLSALPLIPIIGIYPIILRSIELALFTMIWSEAFSDVEWEERGRGFAIMFSLLVFPH